MPAAQRVIGVDVGGTKILAGLVTAEGTLEAHRETPTPVGSQKTLLDALDTAAREFADERVAAVGFGVPSRIDVRTGRVDASVNIPLGDIDLRDVMSQRLALPVAVANDANAATLAEFVAGAGRAVRTMVMLTLGTGVGGGVVIDGRLYHGWAEFGHMVVVVDGEPCFGACTGRGHLEAYASGTAATMRAQQAFGQAADAHRLVRLAHEGDELAREILEDIGRHLGAGIGSLINLFDPDRVVIGGGFAAAGELILAPAREVARRDALTPAHESAEIVRAELGTMAGVIGAGLVAVEALA
jgi:glucokinase